MAQPRAYTPAVDDRATLTQARSMLMLLLATCKQTQIALGAAANALAALSEKIGALPN